MGVQKLYPKSKDNPDAEIRTAAELVGKGRFFPRIYVDAQGVDRNGADGAHSLQRVLTHYVSGQRTRRWLRAARVTL